MFRLHDWRLELFRRYGDDRGGPATVLLGPSLLISRISIITSDPAVVRHVLKDNFANYEKGLVFTRNLKDFLGKMGMNLYDLFFHRKFQKTLSLR